MKRRGGVGEGDGLIAEVADAGGVVGGVEICGVTRECVDGVGVNGACGVAVERVESGSCEGCIGEGDGFITEVADAVGVVGGVEICCVTRECVDGVCVDGARGVAVERVESVCCERGCIGEGDVFITEVADAVGVVGGVEICCVTRECVDGVCVDGACGVAVERVEGVCCEGCIGEGDVFITEVADAVGVVGGVEVCCGTRECVDGVLALTVPVVLLSSVLRVSAASDASVRVMSSSPRLLMPSES